MNKTLHKKLTEKHLYAQTALQSHGHDDILTGLKQEIKILHEAGKDLLQPRAEAIANLLKMARNI